MGQGGLGGYVSPRHMVEGEEVGAAHKSRPHSARPPSAGRHLRPESARPNRDKGMSSPAPVGMGSGGGGGGAGDEARSSIAFDIKCTHGATTAVARVEQHASWQDVSIALRHAFSLQPDAPVVFTYKARDARGGSRQEACSSPSDFVRLLAHVASSPPADGGLIGQLLMMQVCRWSPRADLELYSRAR